VKPITSTISTVREESEYQEAIVSHGGLELASDRFPRSTISTSIVNEPSVLYYFIHRLIDIILSAFGLLLLLPVFLVIAVCLKLDDGGDVLYFREVIGQYGKRFYAIKFRTMIADADDYLEKRPELMRKYEQNMKLMEDPRITKVGRFLRRASLDELPQLFNVLIGQMSLVGPRIIHPSELLRYGEYAQKRHYVRPGITGLWQISGRQHINYDERVLLDIAYIDKRSLTGDLAILFKTLKVLVLHSGV
jgi:exopolysaccharide production protein ExoY